MFLFVCKQVVPNYSFCRILVGDGVCIVMCSFQAKMIVLFNF